MIMLQRPSGQARGRQRRGQTVIRAILGIALLVLSFLLGIAFSRALDDRPEPGDVVTSIRTLTPLPQEPPPRTVTVTVTQP
jgi:hypothetical protein